jgi:hypothetical protein
VQRRLARSGEGYNLWLRATLQSASNVGDYAFIVRHIARLQDLLGRTPYLAVNTIERTELRRDQIDAEGQTEPARGDRTVDVSVPSSGLLLVIMHLVVIVSASSRH